MRKLMIGGAALAMAAMASAPAFADTLSEVIKHGIVLTIQGMEVDVSYTPDGKFTALEGQVTGTWKIQGDKLCTTSNFQPDETCTAYPKDKKSGDTFDMTNDQGTVTVKIK